MRSALNSILICLSVTAILSAENFPDNLSELALERSKTVVAIEFVLERELDRQEGGAFGLVVDEEGTVVILPSKIPTWEPVEKLKDFFGYTLPSDGDRLPMEYLGEDYPSGWHVLKFKNGLPQAFVPITRFDRATVGMGDPVFAVGGLNKDFGFDPYVMTSRVVLAKRMPDLQLIFRDGIANPGCPVFNAEGAFVGWLLEPLAFNRIMSVGRDTMNISLRNPDESSVALSNKEFYDYLDHIQGAKFNTARAWIGVSGMQPIDPEVAKYLGIEKQSGIVLSEILEESPAQTVGLEDDDIVISVDGKPLPQLKPDSSVTPYFQWLIRRKRPGETVALEVIRGEERKRFEIEVGEGPKMVREADYRFYAKLGFTVREFLLSDGIRRRVEKEQMNGAIVNFVKRSSAVETAGLRRGDWIRQIEGEPVGSYDTALKMLDAVEADEDKGEFVLLVERNNETSFIRAHLK